jgi:hypothetical protein
MKLQLSTLAGFTLLLTVHLFGQTSIWKSGINNVASGKNDNIGRSVALSGNTQPLFAYSTTWAEIGSICYVDAVGWSGGSGNAGWSITVETTHYTNIKVSSRQQSSNTNGTDFGPRDFKLQYSLDNSTWIDVTGGTAIVLNSEWNNSGLLPNLALPVECANQPAVYLRWIMRSDVATNGLAITATGQSDLGNIDVTGDELPEVPTDILLDNTTFYAGAASGSTIGTLTSVDYNAADAHTFTLVSGAGSTNNALFAITGSSLRTNASISPGDYSIRVNDNDGRFNFPKILTIHATAYPSIQTTVSQYDYITNVKLGAIDNTTANSAGGYADYTAQTAEVMQGSAVALSVTNNADVTTGYPQNINAYFDWNKNGSFEDAGEQYVVMSVKDVPTTAPISVAVPAGASIGTTRMRIVLAGADVDGTPVLPTSSGVLAFGEAEDYSITVGAALPVELVDFTSSTDAGTVVLHWKTATEINNYGFDVERSNVVAGPYKKIDFVPGNGTSNIQHVYSYTDGTAAGRVYYRLKQIDADGAFSYGTPLCVDAAMPGEISLANNYPNPFNPQTKIPFTLPAAMKATVTLYDLLGRRLRTLFDGDGRPGVNEVLFDGTQFPSGVYIYRLQVGTADHMKRMTLTK